MRMVSEVQRSPKKAAQSINAIRMFLNSELDQYQGALYGIMDILVPNGCCVACPSSAVERSIVDSFITRAEDPPPEAVRRFSPARLCELYPLVATDLDYAVRHVDFSKLCGTESDGDPRLSVSSIIGLRKVARRTTTPRVQDVRPRIFQDRFQSPPVPT